MLGHMLSPAISLCVLLLFCVFLVVLSTPVMCAAHVEDIVEIIFQYIAMLRREGPKEWIFKECSVSAPCGD